MADSRSPRRILIVRPSALGDVCRTVPVLASLRAAYPEARIEWIVRDTFVAAVVAHPALDEVVPFPRSRFAHWWRSPGRARELRQWLRELRQRSYDLVIDLQGLGRSGLMTWATHAPRRVGFAGAPEMAWLAYNVRHIVDRTQHTVDAMLDLVAAEGVEPVRDMRLAVPGDDARWWRERRAEAGLDGRPFAVLAPTARWASKRWPIDRWRDLTGPLLDRGFAGLVVIGAGDEHEQTRGLAPEQSRDADPAGCLLNLVGTTSVGQVMAIVAEASLVVANDSAPLHMAVGFDRPCVALFGPTDPSRVGPYRRQDAIVLPSGPSASVNYRKRRLDDALMRGITLDQVVERIDAVRADPDAVAAAPTPAPAAPEGASP